MSDSNQCAEDGCQGYKLRLNPPVQDDRCLFCSQDPRAVQKRQEGRSSGGKARGRKVKARDRGDLSVPDRPQNRQDLEEWSAFLIEGVGSGALSQSEADTLRKLLKDHGDHIEAAEEEAELYQQVGELADNLKRLRSGLERERQRNASLQKKIRHLEGGEPSDSEHTSPGGEERWWEGRDSS